jgi:hypothetical protein
MSIRNAINLLYRSLFFKYSFTSFILILIRFNISISDTEPAEYLPKYLDRLSQEDKTKMYYWHALVEGWEQMNYPDFLTERRKRISLVVKDAFEAISK